VVKNIEPQGNQRAPQYDSGVSRAPIINLAGFGLTTGLLAIASIASIPAMVSASGPGSWGAIALGQGVGGIAALVVGYGWAVTGPSTIARSSVGEQLNEYADSVRVRLALFLPCAAIAALVASVISPRYPLFTAAGAISATAVAFSAGWFFAGLSRPFLLLGLETFPRVVSTGIGVVLMRSGASAIAGLACMTAGMILAFAIVTAWVFRNYGRLGAQRIPTPTRELLRSRREGIAVMLGAQLFFSAPLAIVSIAAPAQQPVYALADKIRQLVSAGLGPLVMVFQGWVPQRGSDVIRRRATIALGYAAALGLVVIVVLVAVGGRLMHWLGHGEIPSDQWIVVLTALTVAVDLFNSVLVFAVIAALGRLRVVTRATAISIVVMLVVTTVGAFRFGPAGALAGLLTGLIARVALQLRGLRDT
jgi:hypothetical protein